MVVRFHPHARERMRERGATEDEVRWRGKYHRTKQVEAYTVQEGPDWLVITVITRYF